MDKLIKIVNGNAANASVSYCRGHRCVAIANADVVGDHWWIARVFVYERARGKGLGLRLLQDLLAVMRKQSGPDRVIVSPGGYGSDPDELAVFYQRCGFVDTREGYLQLSLSAQGVYDGGTFAV